MRHLFSMIFPIFNDRSFLIFSLFFILPLQGMDQNLNQEKIQADTHYVIVPGQNGLGGQNAEQVGLIHPLDKTHIHHVQTPDWPLADFGQHYCLNYLRQKMDPLLQNPDVKNIVIVASSQGTATVLNYLYLEDQPEKVKAVILEAVMASGNSTIHHTVEKMICAPLAKVPLSYYFLPLLAKLGIYPFYNPAGMQAIKSVYQFEKKEDKAPIPYILLHSESDPQCPYTGAIAIYSMLDQKQGEKVYLFSFQNYGHVFLLSNNLAKKEQGIPAHINHIYKDNKLPYSQKIIDDYGKLKDTFIDLSRCKPISTYSTNLIKHHLLRKEARLERRMVYLGAFTLLFVSYFIFDQFMKISA